MQHTSPDKSRSMHLAAIGKPQIQRRVDSTASVVRSGSGEFKPHLNALLRTFALDVHYHRAQGDSVFYFDPSGEEIEVLDLVGGYGTLLLGHAHPELTAEAIRFLTSGAGNHLQGSVNHLATRLATALSQRAGGDHAVVFASSGSEAVEAAMKHALLETGGRTFLVLERAFHGKTLGALQLTANPELREPFSFGGPNVIRLPPNDTNQLEIAFLRSDLAGFFFEPIQGEGGVREVDCQYLQRAAELCHEHQIPCIADECQTGLGRTGAFLASHALDLQPDYVILSKALGGGIAKISALLIDRQRYKPEFDRLHNSTFGGDGYSCTVALKVLELLDGGMLDDCRRKGTMLAQRLRALQRKYPATVKDVRGRGLMLGVELHSPTDDSAFMLRYLASSELMGLCVAGSLLKTYQIRVAPTLSDPWTLRIQPSALLSDQSIDRIAHAFDQFLCQLDQGDISALTHFLTLGPRGPERLALDWPSREDSVAFRPTKPVNVTSAAPVQRVAWLFHLVDADDLPHLEPMLHGLTQSERQTLLDRIAPLAKPVVMDFVSITSATGASVQLIPILLPVTSRWLKSQFERRQFGRLRALVQRAIDVAATFRCNTVSLGQFTSIVTSHGRHVHPRGMKLTTGNSLSAAIAIDVVQRAIAELPIEAANSTLAIVGAAGDIGRVCAEILVPEFQSALFVGSGNAASSTRLRQIANACGAVASCDLSAIRMADVVVCAASCVDSPLKSEHLTRNAIVCDVSVPTTLNPATVSRRPDVTFQRGGIVRLPGGEELGIPGLPLPDGCAFGCLAEGILLGWDARCVGPFTGRTSVEKVRAIAVAARQHGLTAAECTLSGHDFSWNRSACAPTDAS